MGMTAQPINTKIKNIIKLRSNHPASIKEMIQSDFAKRLQSLELGLQKTQTRLKQFETKYQWSTETFVNLFTSNQLQHSFDFDEWLGEAWILEKLQQKQAIVFRTFTHLFFQSKMIGKPLGISSPVISDSGISHKCINKPRIAFSLLDINTRFP